MTGSYEVITLNSSHWAQTNKLCHLSLDDDYDDASEACSFLGGLGYSWLLRYSGSRRLVFPTHGICFHPTRS